MGRQTERGWEKERKDERRELVAEWRECLTAAFMSYRLHGYPWPSLTTPPYRSSLLGGSQGYIPYPHRAAVCRFELVALLLFGHVRGSIENITYELVPASPAVSCMSASYNFDRKGINLLFLQLLVRRYHRCSSTRRDLALNNPQRLICFSKKTKKKKNIYIYIYI